MKKLIMVVDDDPEVLTLVKKMLGRDSSYIVLGKTTADAVLNVADDINVDLFLVDVMMNDINGIELCKLLRNKTLSQKSPIVMFSANDKEQIRQQALSAGANLFLPKREMHSRLIPTVNKMLKHEVVQC